MANQWIVPMNNSAGVTSGAGIVYHSELIYGFSVVHVVKSFL
jgi:hypothetical protein